MHAIVTGAAGFIGSHLSERLIGDGWRVTGIDAFTDYYARADKEANLAALRGEPRFDARRGRPRRCPTRSDLRRSTRRVPPRRAGRACEPASATSFAGYVHDNLIATQRVLERALDAGCPPRRLWLRRRRCTAMPRNTPASEGVTPTRPRSPYGATKRMCEDLADIYRGLGLSVGALRYFTVYGPRQRPDMAMRRLCEAAIGGPPFTLNGDGLQSRDFTYVADAVDATVRAGVGAGRARCCSTSAAARRRRCCR